jgi:hypothetical protein
MLSGNTNSKLDFLLAHNSRPGVLAKQRMARKTSPFSAKQETILYFSLFIPIFFQIGLEIISGREN